MTLLYFIKCFVSMGIAWSIYKLALANKKSFLFNRGFLLFSIIGLAIVPFLSLPTSVAPVVEPMVPQIERIVTFADQLKEAPLDVVTPLAIETTATTPFEWTWIFYFVGIVLLLRIIYNIGKLSIDARRNVHRSDGQIRIINSKYKNTPFSFFNNLFLSAKQIEEGLSEEVLSHELCHINHYHSVDRIIVELILLIQWWNPFAHLLIRSLKENHEYTADDYALKSKGTSNTLIDQILSYSTRANSNQLFQIGFAQHSIVKRIKMIKKRNLTTSPMLIGLSSFVLITIVFSCTDFESKANEIEEREFEIVTVTDEHTKLEYRYPKSIVDRVYNTGYITGFPEYRPPNEELFNNFVTNPTFEIYLNEKLLNRENYKSLNYKSIKAYRVKDLSHMDSNPNFRASLYTKGGYFEMMNKSISRMKKLLTQIEEREKNVDIHY